MAYPTVSTLPTAPRRGDPSDLFVERANNWIAALEGWTAEVNLAGDYIEGQMVEALSLKNQTQTIYNNTVDVYNDTVTVRNQTTAIRNETEELRDETLLIQAGTAAAVNFKGRWSDLTGALNIPANVFHQGVYWTLLTNLADVTLSEPSAENTDWALAASGGKIGGGGLDLEFTNEVSFQSEAGILYALGTSVEEALLPIDPEDGERVGFLNINKKTVDILCSGTSTFYQGSSSGKIQLEGEVWTLIYVETIDKWFLE